MIKLNKKKISKILDIGAQFLFLDSAKILEKKNCAISQYKIKSSHWTFSSHLLKDPIFPGALLVEIMCQTAMLIIYRDIQKYFNAKGFLRSVNIDFKNTIKKKHSPIKIRSEAKKISFKRGISIYKVKITSLNNKIVFADGEITHFVPLKFIKKK